MLCSNDFVLDHAHKRHHRSGFVSARGSEVPCLCNVMSFCFSRVPDVEHQCGSLCVFLFVCDLRVCQTQDASRQIGDDDDDDDNDEDDDDDDDDDACLIWKQAHAAMHTHTRNALTDRSLL